MVNAACNIKCPSPEAELLLLCSSKKIKEAEKDKIKNLVNGALDWNYLINIARINKLIPLLYWNLNEICPDSIPGEYFNYLKSHFQAVSKSNLYITKELFQILDVLEKEDIFAIPYKGPALAMYLFGNLALREFSDLDIMAHSKDILKIKELLMNRGYMPEVNVTSYMEKAFLKYAYAYELTRDVDGLLVEVHWRITPSHYSSSIDLDNMGMDLQIIQIANRKLPILSREDLIIDLCMHGARKSWEKISMVVDIAELIKLDGDIDWEYVFKKAKSLNCRKMLFLGLFLANDLLDVSLPEHIQNEINNEVFLREAVGQIYERFWNGNPDPELINDIKKFQLKIRDNFFQSLSYAFLFLIKPTVEDFSFIELPEYLSFLYYFIRPYRLFSKYLFHLYGGNRLVEYVPTPIEVVDKMFDFAGVGPGDVIYDVGCGDGRILILAAKKFGIRGVGFDINPQHISRARVNAIAEGVEHLVTFVEKDAIDADYSDATVVTMYLTEMIPPRFKDLFKSQLKPGRRIVSHNTLIENWSPSESKQILDNDGFVHSLRLWLVDDALDENKGSKELISVINNDSKIYAK